MRSEGLNKFDVLVHGFGWIIWKRDAIVGADIIEGFAPKGLGLRGTPKLGKDLATSLQITIESTVTDISQYGQF